MALCTTSYREPYTQLLFAITQMVRTIPAGRLPIISNTKLCTSQCYAQYVSKSQIQP